jgi:predicted MFS family arabinose efflux permease
MSLRQHLTPVRLLGRVTAARRFLLFGAAPLGSALGGVLGGAVGLRVTLLVGAIGVLAALALLCSSPVRGVHDLSDVAGHA